MSAIKPEHPYRAPETAAAEDPSDDLFYRPQPTSGVTHLALPILVFAVFAIAGDWMQVSSSQKLPWLLMGLGAGAVLGVLVLLLRKKKPDVVGVHLRVVDHELCVRLGRRGAVRGRWPLASIADVKLETVAVGIGPSNQPGFGMRLTTGGGGTTDESRISLHLEHGTAPFFLTDNRTSNLEAMEWLAKIRGWLRAHGWTPHDERYTEKEDETELIEMLTEGEYTLTATAGRFDVSLEETRESAFTPTVTTLEIGPEELPAVVDAMLAMSALRANYEGLADGTKAAALIGELFVEPHQKNSLEELARWLRERKIPFAHAVERG